MMRYYLYVHFQGQRVNVSDGVKKYKLVTKICKKTWKGRN